MKSDDEEYIYVLGQWSAFNRVLNHLNTYDEIMIDKTELYKIIFNTKPEPLDENNKLPYICYVSYPLIEGV